MKRYLLCFAFFSFCIVAKTQETTNNLLEKSIVVRIAQLNDYISYMTDKSKDLETRQYYKKLALNLFVGRGYDYYEENGKKRGGAQIEIYSTSKHRSRSFLIRNYLNGLINYVYYPNVQIGLPSISVGNLTQIDSIHYVCSCYYDRIFVDNKVDTPICKSITRKKTKCYIEVIKTENGQDEYSISLGDVYAIDKK